MNTAPERPPAGIDLFVAVLTYQDGTKQELEITGPPQLIPAVPIANGNGLATLSPSLVVFVTTREGEWIVPIPNLKSWVLRKKGLSLAVPRGLQ